MLEEVHVQAAVFKCGVGENIIGAFNDLQFDVLFGQNVLDLVQDLCVRGGRGTDFDGDLICGEAGGNSGEHYAKQHKNN